MRLTEIDRNMLFMVIEHFRNNDPKPIGERFMLRGRMLPEGVTYHASWIDPAAVRCFQVMEAESVEKLAAVDSALGRPRRFRDRARSHLARLSGPLSCPETANPKKKPARLSRTGLHLELTRASLDRAGFALPRQRAVHHAEPCLCRLATRLRMRVDGSSP